MKIKLIAAVAAALSSSVLLATAAHAQSTQASAATAAKPAAKEPAKAVHHAEPAKSASAVHHEVKHAAAKRRPIPRKKAVAAGPKVVPIPDGAEKWSCAENQTLYIKGDMKRDQILTMYYDGKTYQLPRVQTTTGADRFHDLASGMDLVVIPTKAMLFSDTDDDRLADECMTDAMMHNNEPAPTQSNAIIKH